MSPTAMAELEPLRELVTDAEVECLLEALKRDMPHSVHLYNRVATQLRWRRQGQADDVAIYRAVDEGDATDGPATVVSVWRAGLEEVSVALHSSDPAAGALLAVLARSAHIPWSERINFESVHERCLPHLLAEVHARGDPAPRTTPTHKMFLSKEAALDQDVSSIPSGLRMGPLQPHHARAVNESWVFRKTGTEDKFASVIARNPGLSVGLFPEHESEGEPVAFVLGTWYGGLGILYTADSHRRRGLGELVTRAGSRALAAQQGLDVHCNIVYPNPASAATLAKAGFSRVCECTWVHYRPPH